MPFLILAVFVGLETWGILQAVRLLGGGLTLLWLAGSVVMGVWLIRSSGLSALRGVQQAVAKGELPALPLFEGLLGGLAGLLLILPGFVSDAIALSLLIAGGGLRKGLAQKLAAQVAQARPDLKQPVTMEGEFRRK